MCPRILLERQFPLLLMYNGIERAKAIDIQELRKTTQKLQVCPIFYRIPRHTMQRNTETYNVS